MYVHGIPYIAIFIVLQNIVIDSNYSILFGRPLLRDVKNVAHDWGNNMIMIWGKNIFQTIVVTKHMGTNLKRIEILPCFDYQNIIIDVEEYMMFAKNPSYFLLV
jgi:hypothetical protein